ncbi:uncharacterized protein [Setaria viridis]|uniref:uncharacterized protein n=1 Tax=Setaria viridis TaxID=4556 RepID=UPI0014933176|nr:uncharacterized protein LOC117864722 [Setaria viridis]
MDDGIFEGIFEGFGGNGGQGNGGQGGGGQGNGGQGPARLVWTEVMSAFVLRRFTEMVGEGLKTDKGFKEVHLNSVASDLREFTGLEVSGTQVYNHLRKWRAKWVKISKLKELSGSNWDEENYMITLAPEHYKGHIKDHPKDAEYLNIPIKNFVQMQMIFGSGVATGRFAMGSNEALGQPFVVPETMDVEADAPATAAPTEGTKDASSSGGKVGGGKRKRMVSEDDASLMHAMTDAIWGFAAAVQDAAHAEVYPGTYEACMNTPGFLRPLLMKAWNHMTANKASAIQFVKMSPEDRDLWMRTYLEDNNLL